MNGNGVLPSLYDRLGPRAVLIAIPRGSKAPTQARWQKTTFDESIFVRNSLKTLFGVVAILESGSATASPR
jgi:hypothetical protein